jgi:hypothetical protein
VWDVDDGQVRILLATLNRLGGKDALAAKSALYKNLSQDFSVPELAKLLPDSKQVIERLKDIEMAIPLPNSRGPDAFLNTLVFFLNDEQIKIVQEALEKAMPAEGTKAEKMAAAITIIALRQRI